MIEFSEKLPQHSCASFREKQPSCKSIVLNTEKVTAIDGGTAAGKIAKQLVDVWKKARMDKTSPEK